jgi:hypothetical protein
MKKHALLFLIVVSLALVTLSGCGTTPTVRPPLTEVPYDLPIETPQLPHLILVTSTEDNGDPGTLRYALDRAVAYDTIKFSPTVFEPNNPATITLFSALPELDQGNLTIDASDAGVILNGKEITAPNPVYGLSILSSHNIIRGLQITGFSGAGIGIISDNNRVAQYNVIGGDRSIGNGPLGQGNLISGNGDFGIGLWNAGTSGNTIQGNYIGTNLDATATRGQAVHGIESNGATSTRIIGNVIGGNGSAGVYLCCVADGGNTIEGNQIGVGPSGNDLGNGAGIVIDRTTHNMVGPGNTIAFNHDNGISFWENTPYNTVTQNSIRDNGGPGIGMTRDSQNTLLPAQIISWDLHTGNLAGVACANCTVEIFSDQGSQGENYEGQAIADQTGYFNLSTGAFLGPHLTSTTTDGDGTTSLFSSPTNSLSGDLTLQTGNHQSFAYIETLCSPPLAYNHIGAGIEGWATGCMLQGAKGLTMVKFAFNEIEAWPPNNPVINWGQDEFEITGQQIDFMNGLAANGLTMTYPLSFWDKANHPNGWPSITSRFTTEEEIQRYLEYVKFIVDKFRGHGVHYYELWNEPDLRSPIQYIKPESYIELVGRAVPVIKMADPEAKIVVGSVSYLVNDDALEYLYQIIKSDIMPDIDVVAWHPMYGTTPDCQYGQEECEYYYDYPKILNDIKKTAIENGFRGEFRADEIGWCSPEMADCGAAGHRDSFITAANYMLRGTVLHLGNGVSVHLGGMSDLRLETNIAVSNLATILAGAKAEPLSINMQTISSNDVYYGFTLPTGDVKLQTTSTNLAIYAFTLPNGDTLVALWTDGVAVDDDPGVATTLTFFPASTIHQVTGIDTLYSFEQPLVTQTVNGNLLVHDFLVKDYPIILRLVH